MGRWVFVTIFALVAVEVPAFADDGKCSWVGTASACREKAVGSVCTDDDGYAGVCATTYWDHCACAKVAGAHAGAFRRDDDEARGSDNKCGWVGSHDGCRDGYVGNACSRNGRAGVCARSHWDRCDCAEIPGGHISIPSSVRVRKSRGSRNAPSISIQVPGFSFDSN